MSTIILKGQELYAALGAGDLDALRRLLVPDFRGELTAGLPHGLGRTLKGLDAMIIDGWGAVDAMVNVTPDVQTLHEAGDVLIVRGRYVGAVRATGRPLRAAFAHFWPFDGERFTGVQQITDSAAWVEALR
jgi:2-(1,2-epoxy-1,2-dihydrophenyl)acetyl-CoA isomerase